MTVHVVSVPSTPFLVEIAGRRFLAWLAVLVALLTMPHQACAQTAHQTPHLHRFLAEVPADSLVEGATGYGKMRADLPVVQAIVLIFASFYVVLTLLADLLNAYLDPRISVR